MMRALGSKTNHIFVFVVIQALSFAIPGVLLGLIISFVLTQGMQEALFLTLKQAMDYGLPIGAVFVSVILFGFVVPVISIVGPTQNAMGKSLRGSLDASQRSGNGDGVSATVKKLQDLGLSGTEVLVSVFLICFGLMTYYLIPLSMISMNMTLFFFVMNLILTGIMLGLVFVSAIVMGPLQKIILSCLLCCRPKDRLLSPIIERRFEAGSTKNLKIAIMVTFSIAFLILQTSATATVMYYLKDVFNQILGSDLHLSTHMLNQFTGANFYIDEMKLSNYLDGFMGEGEDGKIGPIKAYSFGSVDLHTLMGPEKDSVMMDLSDKHLLTMNIYTASDNFL